MNTEKNKIIEEEALDKKTKYKAEGTAFYWEEDVRSAIQKLKKVLNSYQKNTGLKNIYVIHLKKEIDKIFGKNAEEKGK